MDEEGRRRLSGEGAGAGAPWPPVAAAGPRTAELEVVAPPHVGPPAVAPPWGARGGATAPTTPRAVSPRGALVAAAFPHAAALGSSVGMSTEAHEALLRGLAARAKRADASARPAASARLSGYFLHECLSPRGGRGGAAAREQARRKAHAKEAVWRLAKQRA